MSQATTLYSPKNPVRILTATSLFDGHDASINIMRRIIQSAGCEVIHLGHNRSAAEIVNAAIQEDVNAIAISSYQGGHNEFFRYIVDLLKDLNHTHIKVFGGGGGVIIQEEIKALEDYGVEKIYSPADGQELGLLGIISDLIKRSDYDICQFSPKNLDKINKDNLPAAISNLENKKYDLKKLPITKKSAPVIGITGTGGAGKSSLTDEIILRFVHDNPEIQIAILAIDPTKRKTGGALLGDRIRFNTLENDNIYFRSIATRDNQIEHSDYLKNIICVTQAAGFDLIIVETPGIGQGDAGIVNLVDISMYVMTPEFGATSQLEKIDMLDFADIVAINKFDRFGADDAWRDVCKQVQRNRNAFDKKPDEMPIYGTTASQLNDDGVNAAYFALLDLIKEKCQTTLESKYERPTTKFTTVNKAVVPPERRAYLADIAASVRNYKKQVAQHVLKASQRQALLQTKQMLGSQDTSAIEQLLSEHQLSPEHQQLLDNWDSLKQRYAQDEYSYTIRNKEYKQPLFTLSLAGTKVSKVSLPNFISDAERLSWLLLENIPGCFPFTAGVFYLKNKDEEPGRMFAGEGDPIRTNNRFKLLTEHSKANRLSTAFDSVTLYGHDPELRPDIYGKIGNAGVSICSLDDMKVLYNGFDLSSPSTSVSMTINGPAAILLAMYLNTAIDEQIDKVGEKVTDKQYQEIKEKVLATVRGTVQADILKEDQAQNTCIFSTEFSLKLMADIQEYFVQHKVRNYYSVSISGYHIAEAGANPITQLAFTLSNGFTYVEAYLARGLDINDFAPNLAFFFSNGMDPEYSVMGRVARRIWAIAMRDKYNANERSQKLKYHIQTSGRSLHAQEMAFNDFRTTLEALIAIYDNCNSLHTNAYDEAVTTPTDESVRRAVAIQQVINKEWGMAFNENPNQGSFIIEELTELVEEAVLCEFERISKRGGVLGAMETGYQRSKIQEESLHYEMLKTSGELPIVGVNTFLDDAPAQQEETPTLARSTKEEKQSQLKNLKTFQEKNTAKTNEMLLALRKAALGHENVFAVLMEAVKHCSLGQITQTLFEVGGKYRRNM